MVNHKLGAAHLDGEGTTSTYKIEMLGATKLPQEVFLGEAILPVPVSC